MSAWHELVERDHDVQNPTSPEKIRLVGEYLRADLGWAIFVGRKR